MIIMHDVPLYEIPGMIREVQFQLELLKKTKGNQTEIDELNEELRKLKLLYAQRKLRLTRKIRGRRGSRL